MKVSGFTFIRNAEKFDYPIVETISSILPLCNEVIVAVGNSDDNTRRWIDNIDKQKVKILDTVWDDSLREGGRVLAVETNKAFDAIAEDSDWAFYMQGDEVVHEQHLQVIWDAMEKWKDHPEVDGLLFNYLHFYGAYQYIGDSRKWTRREIRVIRNDKTIRSFGDAHSFRRNNRILRVKPVDAVMYHYGWVKPPSHQQSKQKFFHGLWHNDEWVNSNVPAHEKFDYSGIDSIALFTGTHPKVMQKRVEAQHWDSQLGIDPSRKKFSVKKRFLYWLEKKTGWRPGEYKNYKII